MFNNTIYNEMLIHVPLCTHREPKDILILSQNRKYIKEFSRYSEIDFKFGDLDDLLKSKDKSLDIIISDEKKLHDNTFFAQLNRVLKDDGLFVIDGFDQSTNLDKHKELLKNAGSLFGIVMPYKYSDGHFILGSKKYHPTADIILQRADLIDDLYYYNSDIHKCAFIMPTYIDKELLGLAKK